MVLRRTFDSAVVLKRRSCSKCSAAVWAPMTAEGPGLASEEIFAFGWLKER